MAKENAGAKKPSRIPKEGKGLILLGFSLILLLSLISFHTEDHGKNWLGLVGWGLGWACNFLFGLCSYLVIAFLSWLGWQNLLNREIPSMTAKSIYFGIFLISCCLLLNLFAEIGLPLTTLFENKVYTETHFFDLPYPHRTTRYNLGGVPLYYLYSDLPTMNLQRMLSDVGIGLTFSITAIVSFLLLTEIQLIPLLGLIKQKIQALKAMLNNVTNKTQAQEEAQMPLMTAKSAEEIENALSKHLPQPIYQPRKGKEGELKIRTMHDKGEPEKKTASEPKAPAQTKRQAAISAQKVVNGDFTTFQLPPPSLLNNPKKVDQPTLKKDLKRQAEILEETLLSFGIEAKVGEINCGPTITSFEVHPAIGVKVQKIKTLENDIALNLQAKSIRIIAPIPGKAAVGVEIPSLYPQEVSFKELLLNYHQNPRKMMIPLLLGKTVSGDNVISDLAKMPHCLIAGATGSGKSVCINTVIMSILMSARPDEIKLLMIDPKKVELTPYTNLPHMIAPVITEAHGAYAALSWLVKEMQTRYEILKQLGVRNIIAFNNRQINKELEASLSIPVPVKMHAIVAIIDEFADLMMASSSDLETPIARIAQMARAVGIHLILATQRPSREVITGLIKANFPTRIAFKVSSRVNSQIILDDVGGESLLGNGDMLFLPPGSSALIRSQGAYISDDEINKVVSFICDQAPPNYLIESFDKMKLEDASSGDSFEDNPRDTLYDQALSLVIETRTASTTFLQRKLKIGYARAASLMDELETKGVISCQEGAKPRRILIDSKNAIPSSKPGNSYEEQELFE
ncbi:MAG: DNA translocase FtsK 4TM domain-containing protein [Verrucomicrobia bacterium]|nr:DNA translocase FtsK 4TM domain-containing protein [Verrucomicrobiota bacterium]